MRRRVVALIAGEAVLVAGGLWTIGHQPPLVSGPGLPLFAGYVVALVALGLLPRVYVENKRHASWITPADCAMLIGLFGLGPLAFVAATAMAELVTSVRIPQPPLKKIFNIVHVLGGVVVAALVFGALGKADPLDPVAWLCGIAALLACAAWDVLSTAAVLAIAERQPITAMLRRVAPAVAFSLLLSALLGLAALILFHETPFGPLLFAPVLGILVVSTRGVAHQRAERLRFQRLYEASSRLARLVSLPDMLSMVAAEAKDLMTGSAAVCCTSLPDGTWIGMRSDDEGSGNAPDELIGVLRQIAGSDRQGERELAELPRAVRDLLPACATVLWATWQTEHAEPVLVAVLRDIPADDLREHRAEVLSAFSTHAAAVIANVGLHDEVQHALERQVELNRQKTEFVASVSHELRTPLAAMIGSVQTLQRLGDRADADQRLRLLDMGISQGARLRSLIEDLLLVAAADHREVQTTRDPIPVAELLRVVGGELAPLVGDRFRLCVGEDVGTVLGDTGKLTRIIINLVENARKYAEEGTIELAARTHDGSVEITVTDQGPGIPPEDRERVFERFVQLDQSSTRRQGGTGLGLYLCRQLADLLAGTLSVDEGPDGGARFTLSLPRASVGGLGSGAVPEPATGRLPQGIAASPYARSPIAARRPPTAGKPLVQAAAPTADGGVRA